MESTIGHIGVIKSIDGNTAHVVIDQQSACAECHARAACTASDKTEKIIDARITSGKFEPGEKVMIIGQKSIGLIAVVIAYVIPLLLLVVTLLIANAMTDNELIAGTVGLAILVPYLVIIRSFRGRLQTKLQFYVSKI